MLRALLHYRILVMVFYPKGGMLEVNLEERTGRAVWGQEEQQL